MVSSKVNLQGLSSMSFSFLASAIVVRPPRFALAGIRHENGKHHF